jgi:hypothetical protein
MESAQPADKAYTAYTRTNLQQFADLVGPVKLTLSWAFNTLLGLLSSVTKIAPCTKPFCIDAGKLGL